MHHIGEATADGQAAMAVVALLLPLLLLPLQEEGEVLRPQLLQLLLAVVEATGRAMAAIPTAAISTAAIPMAAMAVVALLLLLLLLQGEEEEDGQVACTVPFTRRPLN